MKIHTTLIGSLILYVSRAPQIFANKLTCSNFQIKTTMSSQQSVPEIPPYKPGSSSIAYITTPDDVIAKKLSHELVTLKLAACVNIIPQVTSIYAWEGKINEDSEVLMMVKTTTDRLEELTKFIRENHPYSVAEVITVPIQSGNPRYLDWISKSVSPVKF